MQVHAKGVTKSILIFDSKIIGNYIIVDFYVKKLGLSRSMAVAMMIAKMHTTAKETTI
jgi:hypothetical protein